MGPGEEGGARALGKRVCFGDQLITHQVLPDSCQNHGGDLAIQRVVHTLLWAQRPQPLVTTLMRLCPSLVPHQPGGPVRRVHLSEPSPWSLQQAEFLLVASGRAETAKTSQGGGGGGEQGL